MKKRAMNPYLPLYEYVPDGEPRIFGERLYVYGSHDLADGSRGFCPGDYVVWSAPVEDLGSWTCHGVSFARQACPNMTDDDALFAPDVVQGTDGRYYLYFNTKKQKECYVAVSEKPEGPFALLGPVRQADGSAYTDIKMFDPGVLVDEDGRVFLYVGFSLPGPIPERFRNGPSPFVKYSLGFRLDADMQTILEGPVQLIPNAETARGTEFEGHGFFEASSPRKVNGRYLLAYSSEQSHELAYASADCPLGEYHFEGILNSNSDLGLREDPVMPMGNNHGGLVQIRDQWYIFYHRHTHGTGCSRQGCAERLSIREDGLFAQAEVTTQGLSGKPLPSEGCYNAAYCCYMSPVMQKPSPFGEGRDPKDRSPYIHEAPSGERMEELRHFIRCPEGKLTAGYKYFTFDAPSALELTVYGGPDTMAQVRIDAPDGSLIGCGKAASAENRILVPLHPVEGVHALYFTIGSDRPFDFEQFVFLK